MGIFIKHGGSDIAQVIVGVADDGRIDIALMRSYQPE